MVSYVLYTSEFMKEGLGGGVSSETYFTGTLNVSIKRTKPDPPDMCQCAEYVSKLKWVHPSRLLQSKAR